MLIKAFEKSCPRKDPKTPEWDLTVVLRSLSSPPYEPLKLASNRDVTLKTVFLLALASAKRVSELHGLSAKVKHSRGWASVTLEFVPEFVAKTQNPSIRDERFESFTIPSLADFTDNDPAEMLLCPVRALKHYLKRTGGPRPGGQRLFVSAGSKRKNVSRNTISFWLREVISKAYGKDVPQERGTPGIKAHQVRGIATSLAFKKNMLVPQVLRAGTWNRQSTFTSFYLREVTHKFMDTFSIGPVVAAQAVV